MSSYRTSKAGSVCKRLAGIPGACIALLIRMTVSELPVAVRILSTFGTLPVVNGGKGEAGI